MFRTTLTLFLAMTAAIGPRVCCVLGGEIETASQKSIAMMIVLNTHKRCCGNPASPMLPVEKERDHYPSTDCHNIPREFVVGVAHVMPIDLTVGVLLPPVVDLAKSITEIPGNNAFARLEGLAMLRVMHILRC